MISIQASHRNAFQTALSSTQIPLIVLPKTTLTGSVHFKETTQLGFMNLHPGNTVGTCLPLGIKRLRLMNYIFSRFAPHDTAYLIQLMGGNVSVSKHVNQVLSH